MTAWKNQKEYGEVAHVESSVSVWNAGYILVSYYSFLPTKKKKDSLVVESINIQNSTKQ